MFTPTFYKLGGKIAKLLKRAELDHMTLVSTDHLVVHAERDRVVGFGFRDDTIYHSFTVDEMPNFRYAIEAVVVHEIAGEPAPSTTLLYLREVDLSMRDVLSFARDWIRLVHACEKGSVDDVNTLAHADDLWELHYPPTAHDPIVAV